jgi:hypothetical protein
MSCKKFLRLLHESEDRDLSVGEESFLTGHEMQCEGCRKARLSMQFSLNMLRSAAMEVQPASGFDRRLIRRVQVQAVKESFSYWTPALIGCALAFIAIFSTLDLLASKGSHSSLQLPEGTASRNHVYPRFELNVAPHFNQ